jgi:hypothetical protein
MCLIRSQRCDWSLLPHCLPVLIGVRAAGGKLNGCRVPRVFRDDFREEGKRIANAVRGLAACGVLRSSRTDTTGHPVESSTRVARLSTM